MNLLTDRQMAQFLTDGYVVLTPAELPGTYHEQMFAALADLYDEGGRIGGDTLHLQQFGDNLLARIPDFAQLLECPTTVGALTSVLGDGYALHPHHYAHTSTPADQGFHQDGNLPWNERGHYRSHRPVWAMLFYYPQAVTPASGPTAVLPGTQYWTRDFERGDGWRSSDPLDPDFGANIGGADDLALRDKRLAQSVAQFGVEGLCPRTLPLAAGSVVLAHYDLFHRGTRRDAAFNDRRYMVKFYFFRTREPRQASWQNVLAEPPKVDGHAATRPIAQANWAWLRGEEAAAPAPDADAAQALLAGKTEDVRVAATYSLGVAAREDESAVEALATALTSDVEGARRASGYGLGLAGDAAVPTLCGALETQDPRVRRVAAFALGETRTLLPAASQALAMCLEDPDDLVRCNASYALGNLGRCQPLAEPVVDAMLERFSPQIEPDNTAKGPPHRSTVRESLAWALLQLARNGGLPAHHSHRFATAGMADRDRYVRGLTAEALRGLARDAGLPWLRPLLDTLAQRQFHALDGHDAARFGVKR